MSCPTCDHTMQYCGVHGDNFMYWCPRCGTIQGRFGEKLSDSYRPKLVDRCIAYRDSGRFMRESEWVRLGIQESICLPAERTRP